MDIKVIKELTKLMRDNDLVEVEVEADDLKVKLRKAGHNVAAVAPVQYMAAPQSAPSPAPASSVAPVPVEDPFANCQKIISPIPGTVYLKASPDVANFVAEGSTIDESKVVCLIEAMKVFNEIKPDSGVKGVIKKICVNDGQPVEYGTVLFLVG